MRVPADLELARHAAEDHGGQLDRSAVNELHQEDFNRFPYGYPSRILCIHISFGRSLSTQ
jgi:hypothetical protein